MYTSSQCAILCDIRLSSVKFPLTYNFDDGFMKKYEVLGGESLPEDLRVTVIIDLCTKDLKCSLELITREMKYKEVREEIMTFVGKEKGLVRHSAQSHGG